MFCNGIIVPFAVKLTRFIFTYFKDILKFFGCKKVKISGTAYIVAFKKGRLTVSMIPATLLVGNKKMWMSLNLYECGYTKTKEKSR